MRGSRSWAGSCEGDALPLGRTAEGGPEAGSGATADRDRADDAGAGLPRAGLHRPAALPRERAADVHPRGQAALLARRGRVGGRGRRRGRGSPPPHRGCRTRRKRSRRHWMWTSSPRRGRTGSDGSTPTCARSEARTRRAPRSRHRRVEGTRRGDRPRARRGRSQRRHLRAERGRAARGGRGNRRLHAQAADVTDPEQVRDFVARSAEALGGIDFLVNNAGGAHPGNFAALTDENWAADYAVKVFSLIGAAGAAAHARRRRRPDRQHRRRLLALSRSDVLRDIRQPGGRTRSRPSHSGGEGQHPRQRRQHRLRDHAAVGEHPPAPCPGRAPRAVLRDVRPAGGAARPFPGRRTRSRGSSRSCSATGPATSRARRSTSPAAWAATSSAVVLLAEAAF